MKTQPIQLIVLEPDDGMVLTNGDTYSAKVYLGINDSIENWWEIPESEIPTPELQEVTEETTEYGQDENETW